MLSISPGSVCDVCLEPFGLDSKVPTSVRCGHIFCLECINNLRASNTHPYCPDIDNGAPCPLCRTRFDQRSMTRLHIDLETNRGPKSPGKPGAKSAEMEARQFHDAFAAVTREGITEQGLRQLLDDAKVFLAAQPRDQFEDLKVLHRIIAYLCDTKSKLRDQRVNHDQELIRIQDEKGALEQQLSELASKRRDEKQAATKAEEDMRDYCTNLQGAYESMIRHYNFLVDEWQKLTEDNERLRAKQYESLRVSPTPSADVLFTPEATPSTFFASHREHEIRLQGTAAIDPESFVISPLPEFTGMPLPAMSALPTPDDTFVKVSKAKLSKVSSSNRARDHLANGDPVHVPRPRDVPHVIVSPSQSGLTSSRNASLIGPAAAAESFYAPASIPTPSEHHLHPLSRSRDSTDVRGSASGSHGHRSTRSRPSNQETSRSPSPLGVQEVTPDAGILSTPVRSGASQSPGSSALNNRLQDLLQDTPVTTSSSLPNMTSHFPSYLSESHPSREQDRSLKSRSPSRSRPASLGHSPNAKPDQDSLRATEIRPSSEPMPIRVKPPVPDLSNAPVSTASMAAQAVEKAKQERRRAEKEAEGEPRKSEKAEKGKTERHSRRQAESERTRTTVASGTSSLSGVTGSTMHTSSGYQQTYTASSAYASQRSLSRSATGSFSADKYPSRPIPIPIAGRV